MLAIAAAIWVLEGRPLPGRGGSASGQQILISSDGGAYVAVEAGPVGDSPGPRVGEPAPDFVLPDLDGRAVQLSSLRGKVVLVNFWATWCVPCRREIPGLIDVYASYRDRGFEIVAVDYQEPVETVRRFVADWGMSYINVLDADGTVLRAYRLTGLPESFFIDRDGIVREMKIGQMKETFVRCVVEALLADAAYRPGQC